MRSPPFRRRIVVAFGLLSALALGAGPFAGPAAAQESQQEDDWGGADAEEDSEPESDPSEDEGTESKGKSYDYRLRDGRIVVRSGGDEVRSVEVPCSPASGEEGPAVAREGDRLLVACGVEGIFVFDVSDRAEPEGVGMHDVEGAAAGFFRTAGRVWVRLETERAQPAAEVTKTREPRRWAPPEEPTDPEKEEPPEEQKEPAEEPPKEVADGEAEEEEEADREAADEKEEEDEVLRGEAVESRPGTVVVDFGERKGLVSGDVVEFYRFKEVELGSGESGERTETLAVGRATTVSKDRAEVELGLNERVEKGTKARRVFDKSTTANSMAPPRVGGTGSMSLMIRPIIPLNVIGLGIAGDVSFKYTFESPLMLEVRGDPVGFGVGNQPAVGTLAGDISLTYDSKLFRVGLGVGASGIGSPRRAYGFDAPIQKSGFTVVQIARLGARDGLQFTAYNSLITFDEAFRWSDLKATGQVPLDRILENTWLIGRAAHQRAGQAYGELGLRVMTSGNGHAGTTYLQATLGGGGIWGSREVDCSASDRFDAETRETCTEPVDYAGPLVGFGLEQRF